MSSTYEEEPLDDQLAPDWEYVNTVDELRNTLSRQFGRAALFAEQDCITSVWIGRVNPSEIDGDMEFEHATMKVYMETDINIGLMLARVVFRSGKQNTIVRSYWLHEGAEMPDDLNQRTAEDDEWIRTALKSGTLFDAKQAQRTGNRYLNRQAAKRRRQLD